VPGSLDDRRARYEDRRARYDDRRARNQPTGDGLIRLNITIATAHPDRAEIKRRVRRQVMLHRLRRELAGGQDLTTILRRPVPGLGDELVGD
jgi:hypothetical protein